LVAANDSLNRIDARRQAIGDVVHAAELLVELAALHRGVLLALEVGEEAVHDAGLELRGRGKHAALRHQLSEPQASEKGRLAALIGAGDDDQIFVVRLDVVADDSPVHVQGETDVIKISARQAVRL
jgi:hypothetical protein